MSKNLKNPQSDQDCEVRKNCPDCGVSPGNLHNDGCDVERCRNCGRQYLSCGCKDVPDSGRLIWTGEWPGVTECREFGWYAKLVPGIGLVSCEKDDPESHEDLNRLCVEAVWSKEQGRFILDA